MVRGAPVIRILYHTLCCWYYGSALRHCGITHPDATEMLMALYRHEQALEAAWSKDR